MHLNMIDVLLEASLFLSLLISTFDCCDNLVSITVKENIPYPSSSLLDVHHHLQSAHLIIANEKEAIYLSDLSASKPFTLTNGQLSTVGPIDREQICHNDISEDKSNILRCCAPLCCKYIGISIGESKTVFVKVIIEDENDNEPMFPQPSVRLQLHENSELGYQLSLLKAEDLDGANFGIDKYELVPDKSCLECFQIKSETRDGGLALVTKSKIDRELNSVFHLQILAIDKGNPSKTGTLSVVIDVLDMNDNYPLFEEASMLVSVEENGRSGREIRNLKVTDSDTGINGQVSYTIEDYKSLAQKYFRVVSIKNGVSLLLQSTLDYEVLTGFRFNVVAKDHGTPSLSSTFTVNIRVTNVNDERPDIIFYQQGIALDAASVFLQLPENGPRHRRLILVHVSDRDSKLSDISCEVLHPKGVFYLRENPQTNGVEKKKLFDLQSSVIFDREVISLYRINIACSDSNTDSKLTHSVEIQLRITDENDNPPVFSANFYFGKLMETNSLDKSVEVKDGVIKVTDADIDINSRIKYSLTDTANCTDSRKFAISSHSPQIKNVVPIDFEEVKSYVFVIVATDCGLPALSASATITVNVLDANDNRPEMLQKFYTFSVLEEEPAGTEIGVIEARDADSDPANKDFIFEIVSHDGFRGNSLPNKLFLIENNTGRIRTRVSLDHEKEQNVNFLVRVRNSNEDFMSRDPGVDVYGMSVSVNVRIIDKNDNSPKLRLKDNQNSELTPSEALKRPMISISNELQSSSNPCAMFPYTFSDADEGINSEIQVSLKSNPHFQLEMGHSLICPKHANIAPGSYSIYVVGKDRNGGNGSRVSEYMINVLVKSISANKPQVHKKPHLQGQEDNLSDYKPVIIFIVLIATIIIFCLLLMVVVVKTKLCVPRNMTQRSRSREKVTEKPNNTDTNKNYNVLIPGSGFEKKGPSKDFPRFGLNNQTVVNSHYSKALYFPQSDNPSMDMLTGHYITSPNVSHSSECMFPDNGDSVMLPTFNQEPSHSRDFRYEQLLRNSSITPNWEKTPNHQYNYLLEPRDSSSLPGNCRETTAPKHDVMTVAAGYQKSINDVYLQTSFV